MLPSPPNVMPGELASERTYSEHGHKQNQLQRVTHDLAKVTDQPGKCARVTPKAYVWPTGVGMHGLLL